MTDAPPRKLLVSTGIPAEYGLLKSQMRAIAAADRLSLSVVATGMHLSLWHGVTVEDIRADGSTVDRQVSMQVDGDTGTAIAMSLGGGTMWLASAFNGFEPEVVLVVGDRGEVLAGTMAAAHMWFLVAYIHGDNSMHGAIIDDSIRHAITKFVCFHPPYRR